MRANQVPSLLPENYEMGSHFPAVEITRQVCPCCGRGMPVDWEDAGLTSAEAAVMVCLDRSRGAWVPLTKIADEIYAWREDGGPLAAMSIIDVRLVSIRRKIKPLGLEVQSKGGARRLLDKGAGA